MSLTTNSTIMDRAIATAEFLLPSHSHLVTIFINSRVDWNVMDEELALQLGLQLQPLLPPFPARALDEHIMGLANNKTNHVCMLLPRGPVEYIQFLLLPAPN